MISVIVPKIHDMFVVTIGDEIICTQCISRNDEIVSDHAVSVSIDDNQISSIQDAINFFKQKKK